MEDGTAKQINADRQSIGYIDSDVNYEFTTHKTKLNQGTCLYLKTDGFTDQLGGAKNLRFGKRRFIDLIEDIHNDSFDRKRSKIMGTLTEYQGLEEQNDDITLIGFKL